MYVQFLKNFVSATILGQQILGKQLQGIMYKIYSNRWAIKLV